MSLKPRAGKANRSRQATTAVADEIAAEQQATTSAEVTRVGEGSAAPAVAKSPRLFSATTSAAGVPPTGRLAVGWFAGDYELARDVYQYAWENRAFSSDVPPTFGAWLGDVLTRWANLTPTRRATLLKAAKPVVAEQRALKLPTVNAARATEQAATGKKLPPLTLDSNAIPRSYKVPDAVFAAVDDARAADSVHLHGQISRGQWARDALSAELARAIDHHGGALPAVDRLTPTGRTTPRPL